MREMLRITEENQKLLKRIQQVRPKYDHEQWERDWQANLQLMEQMSAFPSDWWKTQDQVVCTNAGLHASDSAALLQAIRAVVCHCRAPDDWPALCSCWSNSQQDCVLYVFMSH